MGKFCEKFRFSNELKRKEIFNAYLTSSFTEMYFSFLFKGIYLISLKSVLLSVRKKKIFRFRDKDKFVILHK